MSFPHTFLCNIAVELAQMFWRETEKFGIGESGQAAGMYYFVISYYPPLIWRHYKENVSPNYGKRQCLLLFTNVTV